MLLRRDLRFYVLGVALLAIFAILPSTIGLARAQVATARFISFDTPGAGTAEGQGTFPLAINRGGAIAGYFIDNNNVQHGFIRATDGTFTIVDVPGASGTRITAINSKGLAVGYGDNNGFLRYRNGALLILKKTVGTNWTAPTAINDSGEIVGNAGLSSPVNRGFIWLPGQSFDILTVLDAGAYVFAVGINSTGQIAGSYSDHLRQSIRHGFLQDNAGNVTSFDARADSTITAPNAINSSGQITGLCVNRSGEELAFIRDADGTITTFAVGNGPSSSGINDAGVVVGTANGNNSEFAFERDSVGNITAIDVPFDNVATTASAINVNGRVVGTYYDSTFVSHGWVMTP